MGIREDYPATPCLTSRHDIFQVNSRRVVCSATSFWCVPFISHHLFLKKSKAVRSLVPFNENTVARNWLLIISSKLSNVTCPHIQAQRISSHITLDLMISIFLHLILKQTLSVSPWGVGACHFSPFLMCLPSCLHSSYTFVDDLPHSPHTSCQGNHKCSLPVVPKTILGSTWYLGEHAIFFAPFLSS